MHARFHLKNTNAASPLTLAIAIISGLIVQVPLVTLVMPVVYQRLSTQAERLEELFRRT